MVLMRFLDWLALRIIKRRGRSIDDLLYDINSLCFAILARTASQRQQHLANKIMEDVAIAARIRERINGGTQKGTSLR